MGPAASERRRAAALDTRLASLSDGVNGVRADVVELYNAHLGAPRRCMAPGSGI